MLPLRDLLFGTMIFGSLPLILYRAWVGVAVWYWVGLMNPHRQVWGALAQAPVAQLVALTTLFAMLFARERRAPPLTRETVFLGLLILHMAAATYLFAWQPEVSQQNWDRYARILILAVVTLILIDGKVKTSSLLAITALSIGYWGIKGGLFTVRTGFGGMVLGPSGSFISGSTDIGLALVMTWPLMLVLAREVYRGDFVVPIGQALLDRWHRWLGRALYGGFWLHGIAIIGTFSRGAWVGMAIVGLLIFLRLRYKGLLVGAAVLAIGVVGVTVPDRIQHEWETLVHWEEDASAGGRLDAWEVSWNIAMDAPLTGSGFGTMQLPYDLWNSYREGPPRSRLAEHSIYFQVLGNLGFLGLFLYLSLIGFVLASLWRIFRQARKAPETQWISEWSWGVAVGLIGFLVSGAFLSLAYFTLFFCMLALAIVLRREYMEAQPAAHPARQPESDGPQATPTGTTAHASRGARA
ncbi:MULTISPECIES: putative O-glycosylation ligase, exosortase A system-associated [Halorhodospira]|uniref:putative O-glycosylation ligase, exosortase A system-associated n=1 Tax=Halorhodospira TaxID=85108 RepID=UPI001EE86421|nr:MULTISPECIES: putative O-glycosylation ligase, exosortase A system-associated [Halorhodospira]MCG5528010.1 putative O-glycosylation ligase, exosortase A system-associated [Halorhodospira halophila]MCG5542120.1 putative O-glycosylation ligase, exosortase A system-associated [Halorhodospira sp. 9628]